VFLFCAIPLFVGTVASLQITSSIRLLPDDEVFRLPPDRGYVILGNFPEFVRKRCSTEWEGLSSLGSHTCCFSAGFKRKSAWFAKWRTRFLRLSVKVNIMHKLCFISAIFSFALFNLVTKEIRFLFFLFHISWQSYDCFYLFCAKDLSSAWK